MNRKHFNIFSINQKDWDARLFSNTYKYIHTYTEPENIWQTVYAKVRKISASIRISLEWCTIQIPKNRNIPKLPRFTTFSISIDDHEVYCFDKWRHIRQAAVYQRMDEIRYDEAINYRTITRHQLMQFAGTSLRALHTDYGHPRQTQHPPHIDNIS